jgi:hypothetical protein
MVNKAVDIECAVSSIQVILEPAPGLVTIKRQCALEGDAGMTSSVIRVMVILTESPFASWLRTTPV